MVSSTKARLGWIGRVDTMPRAKKQPSVTVSPEIMQSRNYSADLTAAKKRLDDKPSWELAVAVQRARLSLEKSVSINRRKICLK